jgi:hypothetical protein
VKYQIHFQEVNIQMNILFLIIYYFRLSRFIIKIIRTITNKTNINARNSSSSIFNISIRSY